ncbi:response regulator [Ruminococcaceae bacterium OttesenSCG-928-D13]|nr:response regulator [Ruminococcaceae bacterium OttesenSCG-928-D13]
MRATIGSNQELCVGCNRCTRACPIETANLTYQDEQGAIKTRVDNEKCISCGACVSACKHGARFYSDDLDRFFEKLSAGQRISLVCAPSMKTNFPNWKNLITWLKRLGVDKVYDVALGADICIWAHLRHMEQTGSAPLITQPCPAVVTYIEQYRPELLERLSPVHSPMGCTAIYMREYEGLDGEIAAFSPCFAKADEFEATGLIQYNVVFARLQAYLTENHIILPQEETEFDHPDSGLGALFPMPGGLKENIEFFCGTTVRIDKAEGRMAYELLDEYGSTPEYQLPRVFDVLNCEQGCNIGPGAVRDKGVFGINWAMDARRRAAIDRQKDYYEEMYRRYDERFELARFMRSYIPRPAAPPAVTEADIQRAFELLDKDTYAKQNYNCGACGCETCRDMARRIAMGINIPLNCIVKNRDDTRLEHQRNAEYVGMVHSVAGHLLNAGTTEHRQTVLGSLEVLATNLRARSIMLWKTRTDDGELVVDSLLEWPVKEKPPERIIREKQLPDWTWKMRHGIPMHLSRSMAKGADIHLFDDETLSFQLVPLMVKGEYWGLLSLRFTREQEMTDEEISVAVAIGLLIVSSVNDNQMTRRLIEAREEALAGTRAKSDFLSRMSHEMRTPMNAIIGMTKIAENTGDLNRLQYCLSSIGASSTHLLGLINDVLDMSKIEAGKLELDAAPFDLEQTMIKICGIVGAKAEEKSQRLYVEMNPAMHTWYNSDELRLTQVVTNLLSNAVKFTPQDGVIWLGVEFVGSRGELSLLRFTVSDTGIGMTDEQIDRLFGAFEQADSSIAARYGGTGLGLAISKSIIEKMNGSIWVESKPGQGSTFTFEVEMHKAVPSAPTRPLPRGLRLAVLAGRPEDQKRFGEVAASLGAHCDVYGDTERLMHSVQPAAGVMPYDLVLLDLDAHEDALAALVPPLRAAVGAERLVAMGSFIEWNKGEENSYSGITRFLNKPVFPSTLAKITRQATGAEATPAPQNAVPDFSAVSLLLVEDIEINREIFVALLEATGVQIEVAENGLEAVEKFKVNPGRYDLIVMDIQMPVMDGYEATRTIRAMAVEQAKTVPIIAMTANAFKEDTDRCLASGMNGHLTKPIDEIAVMEIIARYTAQ